MARDDVAPRAGAQHHVPMTDAQPRAHRGPARRWLVPMRPRDVAEPHRASTPLELLADLTFVVAIAQLAAELAHGVAQGHPRASVVGYLAVFFAVWWAWMNFTWFASAYDTDDVPYRLLTLVQMAGVLVLAAGVHSAFEDGDFLVVTLGYVVMRLGLVAQWLRAAASDPEHRAACRRYATGILVVQLGWVARLALPDGAQAGVFPLLVAAEVAVPLLAERPGMTPWHPHHVAERYGLFTIIVLGESVLASTTAVQEAVRAGEVGAGLVLTSVGGLVLLFALWWLYFTNAAGEALEQNRARSFGWGYGHYVVFAALAAVGAGLEVAVESMAHEIRATGTVVALAVALPVAVSVVAIWAVHRRLSGTHPLPLVAVAGAAVAVIGLALLSAGGSVPLTVALVAAPVAVLAGIGQRGR